MPHYFIDLHDGERITPDDDGAAYDGADAARREAIRALTLLANDTLPDGGNRVFTVKVWNETGEPVYEALLSFRGGWLGAPGGACPGRVPRSGLLQKKRAGCVPARPKSVSE